MYLLGKRIDDLCDMCRVKDTIEHVVLLQCMKYKLKRKVFEEKIKEAGREWSLNGILGTEGEGEEIRKGRRALLVFLRDTGLAAKI